MTRRERQTIRKALAEIMADNGDFEGAIGTLSALAGLDYAPARILKSLRVVDFRKLAAGPNQSFRVNLQSRKG